MAPKKKAAPKPMTEDDMRRLGMPEEEIQRILLLKSKTSEERKMDDETERRAAAEKKKEAAEKGDQSKLQQQQQGERKEVEDAEVLARRVAEQAAFEEYEKGLVPIHRDCRLEESKLKLEEARIRRSKTVSEYENALAAMTPEERAALQEKEAALRQNEEDERERQLEKDRDAAALDARQQAKKKKHEADQQRQRLMREEFEKLGIVMDDAAEDDSAVDSTSGDLDDVSRRAAALASRKADLVEKRMKKDLRVSE